MALLNEGFRVRERQTRFVKPSPVSDPRQNLLGSSFHQVPGKLVEYILAQSWTKCLMSSS